MSDASALLFPVVQPYGSGWLEVTDGHQLHFEQYGAVDGLPAVVLHGGPGSGSSPAMPRFFDPQRYRVIVFDQRGCGRSRPAGELVENHTAALVEDIERLRQHLAIERWLVVGGSWGGTLGILYAAAYPQAVAGLLLRNPFLGRQADLDGFFGGAAERHPAAWQAWLKIGAPAAPGALLPWLVERFRQVSVAEQGEIAQVWLGWESDLAGTTPAPWRAEELPRLLARYRLQLHYFARGCFLHDGEVLQAAAGLAGHTFPVHVLQGLSDDVCPPAATRLLLAHLPAAGCDWVAGVGHDPFALPMCRATTRALARFARLGILG